MLARQRAGCFGKVVEYFFFFLTCYYIVITLLPPYSLHIPPLNEKQCNFSGGSNIGDEHSFLRVTCGNTRVRFLRLWPALRQTTAGKSKSKAVTMIGACSLQKSRPLNGFRLASAPQCFSQMFQPRHSAEEQHSDGTLRFFLSAKPPS